MTAPAPWEVLVGGGGAIGSRFEAHADPACVLTFADAERVQPENLGVAAFDTPDLFREKAAVLAARRRARGGRARALTGDLRYTLRPGLARTLAGAVLALDNPAALRDACEALWAAGRADLPVIVLTCGAGTEYQVRLLVPPGPCLVCLFGNAEREADRVAAGTSCADTSAPRASAAAAEAAARAGAAALAAWRSGDRSLANRRLQSDGGARGPYVIRMPESPSPRCPVPHDRRPASVGLGPIGTVTVGALAEQAMARAGEDAEIDFGRRVVPLAGLYCPRCRATWPAPPLLLPAARAAVPGCGCPEPPRPLGERSAVEARDLLAPAVASLDLRAFGAGHGDEVVATGTAGRVRLSCAFAWSDLDDDDRDDRP